MKSYIKLAAVAIALFGFSSFSTESSPAKNPEEQHHCSGKCPINASDYTQVPGAHLEFKIDDKLSASPFLTSLSGFTDFMGFNSATTEAYWRAGLTYIKHRFGIDATTATFDPVLGITYLTVAPDGSSVQTPTFQPGVTNLVIVPVTSTGLGTYRVVESSVPVIQTNPGCSPLVRLAEFNFSFTGPITLSGTYGAEVSPTGSVVEETGNSLAFGRYALRGKDGYNYFFDMRTPLPIPVLSTVGGYVYVSERIQINPLDRVKFVGPGHGTISIVSAVAAIAGEYPTYIRNDWWFGPVVSFPSLSDWDSIPGNTSLIPPGSSVAEKCSETTP